MVPRRQRTREQRVVPVSPVPQPEEIFVAMNDPHHDNDPEGMKFRIKAALALLGIYTAMYLAVAGVIRFLPPPDAVASGAANVTTADSATAGATTAPAGAGDSAASESPAPEAEPTDPSRP
jgi:hypothetical protein